MSEPSCDGLTLENKAPKEVEASVNGIARPSGSAPLPLVRLLGWPPYDKAVLRKIVAPGADFGSRRRKDALISGLEVSWPFPHQVGARFVPLPGADPQLRVPLRKARVAFRVRPSATVSVGRIRNGGPSRNAPLFHAFSFAGSLFRTAPPRQRSHRTSMWSSLPLRTESSSAR